MKTDIIAIAIEGTRETIFEDLVLPMDDAIAADEELQAIVDEVEPVLHNALKGADGQTYYFTREWNNMIIHYNPVKFEEAGLDPPAEDWTWEDFLETASILTTGEGGDKQFGFAIPFFNFGLTPWWHTNGTATLDRADWSQSNLDDPKMLESVKFVHSLVHEHGVAPSVEGVNPYELFPAGTIAMTGAGRWPFDTYVTTGYKDVDITPWPRKTHGTTVFGSGGWAVSKTTENVPLALELIKDLAAFRNRPGSGRCRYITTRPPQRHRKRAVQQLPGQCPPLLRQPGRHQAGAFAGELRRGREHLHASHEPDHGQLGDALSRVSKQPMRSSALQWISWPSGLLASILVILQAGGITAGSPAYDLSTTSVWATDGQCRGRYVHLPYATRRVALSSQRLTDSKNA